ncbi:MAG: hypothetical protein J6S89_10645, partial [Paludibacteraceae bacterium]|nr:hypothetical protein [Paludibacteraceae bacterium]
MKLRAAFLTLLLTGCSLLTYSQSDISAPPSWLHNTSEQKSKFGQLTAVTSMGDKGFCLVQKYGMIYTSPDGRKWSGENLQNLGGEL